MQLSEAEWTVMRVVWKQHPASARDVLEVVRDETRWAYTTVKTILSRLVDKGALRVTKRANTSLYAPALSQEKAQGSAVRSLIDRAFDGAFGPLLHFVLEQENLSPADRARLIQMLKDDEETQA